MAPARRLARKLAKAERKREEKKRGFESAKRLHKWIVPMLAIGVFLMIKIGGVSLVEALLIAIVVYIMVIVVPILNGLVEEKDDS